MATRKTNAVAVERNIDIKLDVFGGCDFEDNLSAVKDSKTRNAIKTYVKERNKVDGSLWGMAIACSVMKTEEFGSDEVLAHFLGMSDKSTFNKQRRIAKYANRCIELGVTTSKASELLVLESDKYTITVEDYLNKNSDIIFQMSAREIREDVKSYKKKLEEKEQNVVSDNEKSVSPDDEEIGESGMEEGNTFKTIAIKFENDYYKSISPEEISSLIEKMYSLIRDCGFDADCFTIIPMLN